ncbi:MAG: GHKL domain-containing protein [Kiritimatiellae bacterium]|nr:GHKL domain-containing protein [Kiritimatiellia bacterium]
MRQGFFDKFISRLDRIDAPVASAHIMALARERGFLETLFQSINEGILVLGDEMRLLYANTAAERMIGFSAEKTRACSMKRHLRDWGIETLLRHQVGNWNRIETREVEISYPEKRIISYYARPVNFEDRTELLLMLRDVTHERRAEEDTLADERLVAVKTLVAGVAHEIGNPLNALTIHLQLLMRELPKVTDENCRENLQELATIASQEVTRLDTIIRRFLTALRPTKPNLVRGNIKEVLTTTLRVLTPDIEQRSIELQYSLPDQIPDVFLDAQQMEQVFFNLLKNAMDAIPNSGKIGVTVTVDNASIIVSILDNGTGIPEPLLGRIFDPYVTTKNKGSGLGLMVVKRIVQSHGGTIECASHEGEGTCFTVRLPRAERQIRTLESAVSSESL